MKPRAFAVALSLAVVCFLVAPGPAAASGKPSSQEYITANVVNMNPGAGRNTGRLTIRVFGSTSDEQRHALLSLLTEKGSEALVEELRKEPVVGTMAFTSTLAYDLHYARVVQQGETRHLILATDRPIMAGEVMRNTRSLEKGVTIIHLEFTKDAKGKLTGKGQLLMGAELTLDASTNELGIEHLGIEPMRLSQVTSKIKKKK